MSRPERARRPARRCRSDGGQVGGIEAIPFGLLVFVAGSLLVANAWAVVDAKFATDAAAHQAARAFAEADGRRSEDRTDGPIDRAIEAGLAVIDGHGRDRRRAAVVPDEDVSFERCARATFVVTYKLPALTVPFLGGLGDGIEVTSRASERVDAFRAGVPGDVADCR